MKKPVLVVVLAVAVLSPVAATAGRQHHFQAIAGRKTVALRTARQQIATLRASLARTRASLADTRTALANSQSAAAAAAAKAATLQAQLNAIPAPLTTAVQMVRHQVAYMEYQRTGSLLTPLAPDLIAKVALDYTIGHIKSYQYGYLEATHPGEPIGGPDLLWYYADPNLILAGQAGVCGHHEYVLARILQAFGLRVREISFSWTWNGIAKAHAAEEVYYNGGWHFFDPTFGTYWTDASGNVLSIADVRAGLGTRVSDQTAPVNVVNPDQTAFETDPATTVTYEPAAYGY